MKAMRAAGAGRDRRRGLQPGMRRRSTRRVAAAPRRQRSCSRQLRAAREYAAAFRRRRTASPRTIRPAGTGRAVPMNATSPQPDSASAAATTTRQEDRRCRLEIQPGADQVEFRRPRASTARASSLSYTHPGSASFDIGHWREVYAQLGSPGRALRPRGVPEYRRWPRGVPARTRRPSTWQRSTPFWPRSNEAYPQYRLWLEPNRYLVAEAGVLLASR